MQPLQNVLSISTAGKNRYLFHFNSLHSLTQWTAGIRLAMFEHATLQEAYTGSLIAGKGKSLNNIRIVMDRTKLKTEDWTRVRFGAGTPWRRCWCVISPPDEKDVQKQNKSLKKKSAYERTAPALKGDIKFYDTKKTKKALPIATIRDAYSAYAIYPQSKPLIDQSTLVKVEGMITIHSTPETTTEGFVFVMPEVHPGVSGFEMLLRWLFPLYDVFGLYGRPNRLIADTLDVRSLMFALPQERRYGYLEILDVAQLIHEPGSQTWNEQEWRRRLKELTSSRITKLQSNGSRSRSRASTTRGHRNSLPSRAGTLRYEDGASIKSTPSIRNESGPFPPPRHTGSAPPGEGSYQPPPDNLRHQRSVSEVTPFSMPPNQRSQRYQETQQNYTPSRLSYEATPADMPYEEPPPLPPAHGIPIGTGARNIQMQKYAAGFDGIHDRSSSESERRYRGVGPEAQEIRQELRPASPPTPVIAPPVFAHEPGAVPQRRPELSPELRRATSRMSITTLAQLADAGQLSNGGNGAAAGAASAWRSNGQQREGDYSEDHGQRGVIDDTGKSGTYADYSSAGEGMVTGNAGRPSTNDIGSQRPISFDPEADFRDQSFNPGYGLVPPTHSASRNISPLSQSQIYPQSPTPPSHSEPGIYAPQNNESQLHEDTPTETFSQPIISTGIRALPIPVDDDRPDMRRLSTSCSVTRKPVPGTLQQPASEPVSEARSSLESLRQQFVDEDALDQVIAREPNPSDNDSLSHYQTNDIGSIYDGDSTASPDYASTRQSTETKRSKPSMDKPRRGVLKTVGTVEPEIKEVVVGDMRYQSGASKPQIQPAIPSVNFGPTHAYTPGTTSRPGTSGTLSHLMHERSKSRDGLTPSPQPTPSPRNETADDLRRSSKAYNVDGYDRSPSRNLHTPEPHHQTPGDSEQDNRRSVAWQPGATIGSGSPGNRQSITPEQFVQQRASQSAATRVMTPVYAHGPKQSNTPPMASRNPSGELPVLQHGRQASYSKELPSRPHSRGASTAMNTSGDYSTLLSAREQEHVARVTGSPLINVASNPSKKQPQGGGLVGAIEAREQEKKNMKEGLSGQLVQQAIAQRQQHNQGYHTRQQSFPAPSPYFSMPGQYPATPSPYPSMPGQYPQTPGQYGSMYGQPQYATHQQQQQQWVSPSGQPFLGNAATPPQYRPQIRHGTYPQQGQYQQGQNYQNQQENYGPYFGYGQGGRQ